MIVLALAAAAQWPLDTDHSLLTLSIRPALCPVTTRISAGIIADPAGRSEYWFQKSGQADGGDVVDTRWADIRTCPSGRTMLEEIAGLEMPQPHIYGIHGDADLWVVADGVTYRLETEVAQPGGRLSLETNAGTPLAGWAQAALRTLARCWTRTAPQGAAESPEGTTGASPRIGRLPFASYASNRFPT